MATNHSPQCNELSTYSKDYIALIQLIATIEKYQAFQENNYKAKDGSIHY